MAKRKGLSGETLALSLLTVGESAHAFSAMMPSSFTIKNWVLCSADKTELAQNVANLRTGYMPSVIFGTGLGAVISILAKSPLPIIFSLATSAVMITMYERALPPEMRLTSPLQIFSLPAAPTASMPALAANSGDIVNAQWAWVA